MHHRDVADAATSKPGDEGKRAIFRIPGANFIAIFLLAVCMTPLATTVPGLAVLYIVPIALTVWVLRVRTVATANGLSVRTLLRTRELPWDAISGLALTSGSRVRAVLSDESQVWLPAVRPRNLPVLSLVSGGRFADPSGVLTEPADSGDAAEAEHTSTNDAAQADAENAEQVGTTYPDNEST